MVAARHTHKFECHNHLFFSAAASQLPSLENVQDIVDVACDGFVLTLIIYEYANSPTSLGRRHSILTNEASRTVKRKVRSPTGRGGLSGGRGVGSFHKKAVAAPLRALRWI